MNFYSTPSQVKPECPEDLLAKEEDHEEPTAANEKNNKFLNLEELRKMALEVIFFRFCDMFLFKFQFFLKKFKFFQFRLSTRSS